MVDHNILLTKLQFMGVRGVALQWFRDYLCFRKQYVNFDNTNSSYRNINRSIPQGSILGPVLFNIYINDIVRASENVKVILFADDCCIFGSHKNLDFLKQNINSDLVRIHNWIVYNKLSINYSKSQYMLFSRKLIPPLDNFPITINNSNISKVTNTNFLGFLINDKLNWKSHINFLISKVNKYRAIIFLVRNNLTKNSLKLIYHSLVYSNILYGNVI